MCRLGAEVVVEVMETFGRRVWSRVAAGFDWCSEIG
jgi:hypothetical protein